LTSNRKTEKSAPPRNLFPLLAFSETVMSSQMPNAKRGKVKEISNWLYPRELAAQVVDPSSRIVIDSRRLAGCSCRATQVAAHIPIDYLICLTFPNSADQFTKLTGRWSIPPRISLSLLLMMGPLRAPTVPLYIRSSGRAKQKGRGGGGRSVSGSNEKWAAEEKCVELTHVIGSSRQPNNTDSFFWLLFCFPEDKRWWSCRCVN
jgi:hypothetical protein